MASSGSSTSEDSVAISVQALYFTAPAGWVTVTTNSVTATRIVKLNDKIVDGIVGPAGHVDCGVILAAYGNDYRFGQSYVAVGVIEYRKRDLVYHGFSRETRDLV